MYFANGGTALNHQLYESASSRFSKHCRVLALISALFVAISLCSITFTDSSEADIALEISTPEQLMNMQSDRDYTLKCDIDMSSKSWTPIDYSGTFQGWNYKIIGLRDTFINNLSGTINWVDFVDSDVSTNTVCGIVANTVTNTGVISSVDVSGKLYSNGTGVCGGIAGTCSGTIEDSTCSAEIETNLASVGGIVGNLTGKLDTVEFNGKITTHADNVGGIYSTASGTAKGNGLTFRGNIVSTGDYVGGIAGTANFNATELSLGRCTVQGKEYVGGLYGKSGYALNEMSIVGVTVIGVSHLGGLSGYQSAAITGSSTVGGIVKTTDALFSGNAYVGGLCGEITCAPGACEAIETTVEVKNGGSFAGILFGQVSADGATISGLKASGSVTSNGSSVGGLIGHFKNTNTSTSWPSTNTVSNCTNEGSIQSTGDNVGGLIGYSRAEKNSRILISNCSSTVDVIGKAFVGGLIGRGELTIVDSIINSNDVNGTIHVGGIAGYIWQATNCTNTGNITATDYDDNKNTSVGGIAGEITNYVNKCTNSGNIKSEKNGNYVAGIVGLCSCDGATIKNLKNSGSVTSNGNSVGGLFGHFRNSNTSTSWPSTNTISECTNEGTITSSGNNVGGLIGHCWAGNNSRNTITRCSSTVDIEGASYYAGGLVGKGDLTLIDSSAHANNVSGKVYVGGIVGYAWQVTNCTNTGDVAASDYDDNKNVHVGGIAGEITNWVNECENSGNVISAKNGNYVAGIVGLCSCDGATIKNLKNSGSVTSNGNSVGGLFGHFRNSNTSTSWPSTNTISECTNEGTITSSGNNVGGLIGHCWAGKYSNNTITRCSSSVDISGNNYVGGLIGLGQNTTVKMSDNNNSIKGKECVGGIAGSLTSASDCTNTGSISGQKQFGQISGSGGNLTDCTEAGTLVQLELDPEPEDSNGGGNSDSSGGGMCSMIIAALIPAGIGLMALPMITRRF